MSELKTFDCPKCGRPSTLDPATLNVEHSDPKCEAWLEMERRPAGSLESLAAVLPLRPAAGPDDSPPLVEFACPECGKPALLHPLREPMEVQHSLPACALWERIEGKKDDVERYLIKAGVHVHVPERHKIGEL